MADTNFLTPWPTPVYPYGLDSDATLFHVYNSTQSVLTREISFDSVYIDILPVEANDPEVWAENGFATLPGELIYYDATERNMNGKVATLLRCHRAIEGNPQSHSVGTPIYGNVVAQTHNQLVDAIIALERTIGDITENLEPTSTDPTTPMFMTQGLRSLQGSLQNLTNFAVTGDDSCPDVEFEFNTPIPVPGDTTAEFCVRVYGWKNTMGYTLDFGDGSSTTTEFSGTHLFASGGPYTPTVTITDTLCSIVQQPSAGINGLNVEVITPTQAFHIPIPDVPAFPTFVFPSKTCPGQLFNLPPMIINTLGTCSVASVASCTDCVSITGCCIPSQISIVGCCPPSVITFAGCCPPSVITFAGCCPPSVISVDWGTPPVISVSIICETSEEEMGMVGPMGMTENASIPITYGGIPEQITLVVPKIPDINVVTTDIPKSIRLDARDMPRCILVEPAGNFPTSIKVDMPATLQVTGIPPVLEVIGIPKTIQLLLPENAKIPLVYEGPAIEMRLSPNVERLLSQIMMAT